MPVGYTPFILNRCDYLLMIIRSCLWSEFSGSLGSVAVTAVSSYAFPLLSLRWIGRELSWSRLRPCTIPREPVRRGERVAEENPAHNTFPQTRSEGSGFSSSSSLFLPFSSSSPTLPHHHHHHHSPISLLSEQRNYLSISISKY
jgi:hypothetical protein